MVRYLGVIENGINILGEVPQDDYEQYRLERDRISFFVKDQELLEFVKLNFFDYKYLFSSFLSDGEHNPEYSKLRMLHLDINRRISNILSSLRTYLDHSETNMKRHSLVTESEFNKFKNACSQMYDDYFAYRFLYQLRNYVQHCGMPVSNIKYSVSIDDPEEGTEKRSLEVLISRDELLDKFNGWGKLENEILGLSEFFEINPYIEQVMHCLDMIDKEKHEIYHDKFEASIKRVFEFMESIFHKVKGSKWLPCILNISDTEGKPLSAEEIEKNMDKLNIHFEWFPLDVLREVLRQNMQQCDEA